MVGRTLIVFLFSLGFLFNVSQLHAASSSLKWLPWTEDLFEKAKKENKFVLLDLEAVWCHWCHVMDKETYSNADVQKLIGDKYLPVRVDQDANPDLSNRYGDWGWPATIVFAPDGTEIVKIRGYIPPPRMIALLKAIIEDPSPGPSVLPEVEVKPASSIFLSKKQRELILGNYEGVYDKKDGGWGQVQKFIHTESMDYAMAMAEKGDAESEQKVKQTLEAARALIDPVWGGVYQYSDKADWSSPHFEKIMWFQAQYLRQYSQAYAFWENPKDLATAKDIYRYLTTLLMDKSGALYTSQDADVSKEVDGKKFYALGDQERKKLGMPRVDKNIYARENGWAVSGMVALYNVTNDKAVLDHALKAANWVLENRGLKDGGFRHGEKDRGGPFLGDTLAMGQASLDLYAATGDRKWLKIAGAAGDFIGAKFRHKDSGFITSATTAAKVGVFSKPFRNVEENIQLVRFLNSLYHYYGSKSYRDMSEYAMRYLASDAITSQRRFLAGIVLAEEEIGIEPAHITIVGRKDDAQAQALHAEARRLAFTYKRIDWWDKKEGPMINPDVTYPELDKAAAFACANKICSLPVFKPKNLKKQVDRVMTTRVAVKEKS